MCIRDRDGCSSFSNASSLKDKIVVVNRGACYFATKAFNASIAEAKLIIIINNNTTNPNSSINLLIIKFKLLLAIFLISINNESN